MKVQYFKNYSHHLGRDMEFKVYGHAGRPVLFIPCQNGRFMDFEGFNMDREWAQWINAGKVMVFSIDTIDSETWSDINGDPYRRIRRHERWIKYIVDELVPFIRNMANVANGWSGNPRIIVFGASMGANHSVNLFLRYPDIFDGMLALSGVYDNRDFFGNYMDEVLYRNSPQIYLANMQPDHPFIQRYNNNRGIICTGQGAWEEPGTARRLDENFRRLGINIWVDYWGYDVSHDWPWWYKQVQYFVPKLLGEG